MCCAFSPYPGCATYSTGAQGPGRKFLNQELNENLCINNHIPVRAPRVLCPVLHSCPTANVNAHSVSNSITDANPHDLLNSITDANPHNLPNSTAHSDDRAHVYALPHIHAISHPSAHGHTHAYPYPNNSAHPRTHGYARAFPDAYC